MKKVTELDFSQIEKKINYTFKDKSLLTQAFTRTSFCNEINPTSKVKYHSNEVLEFFGDGVLSLSIISFLLKECTERYEHGIRTELGEGDFSNIKSKLSDKQNLSRSMKALGLEKYLLMGEGDAKLGIQNEPSVMEDLFESIVGAIFIDSNMNIHAVIDAVSSMLDMSVYTDRQKISQSAKNALQEWCADKKRRLPAPRYETLSEDGPDHKKTYMRGCYIGDKLMGRGIGKNFKLADAAAAEDALKALTAQNEQEMKSKVVKSEQNSIASSKDQNKPSASKSIKKASEPAAAPSVVTRENASNEKKSESYAALIKSYAISNKKTSPAFKDLGERRNGAAVECAVECSFMDTTSLGVGKTRLEAREAACKLMLEKLGIGKKEKATQKSAAKETKSAVKKPKAIAIKASPAPSEKQNIKSANKNSAVTEKQALTNAKKRNEALEKQATTSVGAKPRKKRAFKKPVKVK